MADAIVSYLINKLDVLATNESSLLLGVEEQLGFLQDEFEYLSSLLREADIKRRKSDLVGVWTTQVRDIAYDTEDLIDQYMLLLELRSSMNKVRKLFNYIYNWKSYHDFGKQIQHINTRLTRISDCKGKYGIDLNDTQSDPLELTDITFGRQDSLTADESSDKSSDDLVDFRKESTQRLNGFMIQGNLTTLADKISTILPPLRKDSTQGDVHKRKLIPIVGRSGLGKTILAYKIYTDDDVSGSFDVRIWITVSQMYLVKDLLLQALKVVDSSYYDEKAKNESDANLKSALRKRLTNKKYLLIIDDIRKEEAWDAISSAFPDNRQGSRVIFTTQSEKVAKHVDRSGDYFLQLPLLNKQESIELFCRKVFSQPVTNCPPDLVKLGKEFVEQCGGLPFPIVVICGILKRKERKADIWRKVLASLKWHLEQDTDKCRQVLIFSYSCLPYYLRRCFVYFGLFPDHCEIEAKRLIKLWVAEGFVEAANLKLEDVAGDYLEELVKRGLLQVTDTFYHGGPVKKFRVHHLLRDLIISEGRFMDVYTNNSATSTSKQRRLAVYPYPSGEKQFAALKAPNLRCLLVFKDEMIILKGNKMLRVLDLQGVALKNGVPKEIENLRLLHYLGLRDTGVKDIPSFIGNFFKLQTIDIKGNDIKMLPKSIWKLKNLRQLLMDRSCEEIERGMTNFKHDFGSNLLGLRVSGALWMKSLSKILMKRDCLRVLRVHGNLLVRSNHFPSTITDLVLNKTFIQEDPSEILGSLSSLKMLQLLKDSYIGKKMVFSKGRFPKLEYLLLYRMTNLSKWTVEENTMPILVHLEMSGLMELKQLPEGLKNVKSLVKIQVQGMPLVIDRIKEKKDQDIINHVRFVEYYEDQYE